MQPVVIHQCSPSSMPCIGEASLRQASVMYRLRREPPRIGILRGVPARSSLRHGRVATARAVRGGRYLTTRGSGTISTSVSAVATMPQRAVFGHIHGRSRRAGAGDGIIAGRDDRISTRTIPGREDIWAEEAKDRMQARPRSRLRPTRGLPSARAAPPWALALPRHRGGLRAGRYGASVAEVETVGSEPWMIRRPARSAPGCFRTRDEGPPHGRGGAGHSVAVEPSGPGQR